MIGSLKIAGGISLRGRLGRVAAIAVCLIGVATIALSVYLVRYFGAEWSAG